MTAGVWVIASFPGSFRSHATDSSEFYDFRQRLYSMGGHCALTKAQDDVAEMVRFMTKDANTCWRD